MKETILLALGGVLLGIGLCWLWGDPGPDVKFVLPLVTLGGGFAAGLIADQIRVRIWVRQETWKVRRELYSDIIRSVSEMRAINRQLTNPFPLNDAQRDILRADQRGILKAFLNAKAAAAVVDPPVYELVREAEREWREALPPEEHFRNLQRQDVELDAEWAALDQRFANVRRRIGALIEKQQQAADVGGEGLTADEQAGLARLFDEQAETFGLRNNVLERRGAILERTGEEVRAHQAAFFESIDKLEAKVVAAAARGLKP